MYHHKKQNPSTSLILIVMVCILLDFLMFGGCAVRFIQWSSAAYIVTLVMAAPLWLTLGAAWSSVMVNTLLHGRSVDEIALTLVIGLVGMFLAERTVSLPFARHMLASLLMGAAVMATLFLQAEVAGTSVMNLWTLFQIIANIIIVNLLLKYTS